MIRKEIKERFEFREVLLTEDDEVTRIEQICFPPNEACSERQMKERVREVPELFLVAVEKSSGKIAGFLNGLATDEEAFRDEFFQDASLHRVNGRNIMLLGLDVLPKYRGQGLAKEIVAKYVRKESKRGRKKLILTCLEEKIAMYQKMGFFNHGIADSTWGGEEWYEMVYQMEKDLPLA